MNSTLEAPKVRGTIPPMGVAKWKLSEFLEQRDISPYQLAKTIDRHTQASTIYGLVRKGENLSRIDFTTLALILDGLRELTGENVQVTDLISYTPDN